MTACTNPAGFYVGLGLVAACQHHLAQAVTDDSKAEGGTIVVPVPDDCPCQVPSRIPFGFTSQRGTP